MTEISQHIIDNFKVRKNSRQKQAFRNYICQQFEGAAVTDNDKLFKSKNVVIGDVRNAKVVLTAHYDTPPTLPFPNFITPKNLFVFILYQIVMTVFVFAIGGGFSMLVNALWTLIFGFSLSSSVLSLLGYCQYLCGKYIISILSITCIYHILNMHFVLHLCCIAFCLVTTSILHVCQFACLC